MSEPVHRKVYKLKTFPHQLEKDKEVRTDLLT